MAGKGDNTRPRQISFDEYSKNWDSIDWGKKKKEQRKTDRCSKGENSNNCCKGL